MTTNVEHAYRAARSAYEWARVRAGLLRGVIVTAAVAIAASIAIGPRSLVWLPVTFVVAAFSEWWGAALVRGVRRGLVAGLVMLAMPLSVLRPCCNGATMMAADGSCCTMPGACVAAGALYGMVLAFFLPRVGRGKRASAALGMALGASAVASARCAPLFLGESLGLLGGLFAGVVATGLARAWWQRGVIA